MNLTKYKRICGILTACTMTASLNTGFPQFIASAADYVHNATFDSSEDGWYIWTHSSASAAMAAENGKLTITVSDTGEDTYHIQAYFPYLTLYEGCEYRLTYDISSDISCSSEAMVQRNSGDYDAFSWRMIDVSPTVQTLSDTFTMTETVESDARITFTAGYFGTELAEHKIYIDNVKLELISGTPPVTGPDNNILYPNEAGSVVLNEFCTQNKECLLDSYGTASDWIELHNPGGTSIDISGYGLTDKASEPYRYIFPEGTVLEAGEYRVIFASKSESSGNELHTGFALSKSGETMTLTDPSGKTVQTVTIPTLAEDVTYGLSPEGSGIWASMTPTPTRINEVSVPSPVFSASSGFYDADFNLTLSTEAVQGDIYYTLDGSDPTTSDTAIKYSSPIKMYDRTSEPNVYSQYQHDDTAQSITLKMEYNAPDYNVDKITVVRAAVKRSDGQYSDIITNSYIVGNSEDMQVYKDIAVISLVTDPDNLFDPDTGIYVAGTQYVNWKNSSSYNPNLSEWDASNVANFFSRGRSWERPVTFELFENGESVIKQDMGLRIKGTSTRNCAVKNFNLFARSDYGDSKLQTILFEDNFSEQKDKIIKKYDSISLRAMTHGDGARIRETIGQELLSSREAVGTQDYKPCVVFIDGEYWGVYQIGEKISDYFIQSHYDIPKEQVSIIKRPSNTRVESGTEADADEWDYLMNYAVNNNAANDSVYNYLAGEIDMQSLIEHYCTGLYLGTFDWPGYNFVAWKNNGSTIADNPYSDGKWRFVTYDLDYTMGSTYETFGGVEGYAYNSFDHIMRADITDRETNKLFKGLLKNEAFKEQFALTYQDYANYVFAPETAAPIIEKYRSNTTLLSESNESDKRWGLGFEACSLATQLNTIEEYFENRASYTLEDMRTYLGLTGTLKNVTLKANGNGTIQINTITPELTNGSWTGQYYTDYPVTVTAIPAEGAAFTGWTGAVVSDELTVTVPFSTAITLQANFAGGTAAGSGDINADGQTSILDAVLLQKHLVGAAALTDSQLNAADVTSDKTVNIFDLAYLKKIIMG